MQKLNLEIVRLSIIGFMVELTNGSLDRIDHIYPRMVKEVEINAHHRILNGGDDYRYWGDEDGEKMCTFFCELGVNWVDLLGWEYEGKRAIYFNDRSGSLSMCGNIHPRKHQTIGEFAASVTAFMQEKKMFEK